jgi:hypothetical protein
MALAAAILLALALLLAVPVAVAFRFQRVEAFEGRITVRWLFGVVRFDIQIPGNAKPAPARPKPRAKPGKRGAGRRMLAVLRQTAFRRRMLRLLRDLVAAAHLRRLDLRMRLGLGDPADTGRLWAFVGPLNAAAGNLRGVEVQIEPEFVDPLFELHCAGRLFVVPLQLLALAIAFALSPASLRAWRTLIRGHA